MLPRSVLFICPTELSTGGIFCSSVHNEIMSVMSIFGLPDEIAPSPSRRLSMPTILTGLSEQADRLPLA